MFLAGLEKPGPKSPAGVGKEALTPDLNSCVCRSTQGHSVCKGHRDSPQAATSTCPSWTLSGTAFHPLYPGDAKITGLGGLECNVYKDSKHACLRLNFQTQILREANTPGDQPASFSKAPTNDIIVPSGTSCPHSTHWKPMCKQQIKVRSLLTQISRVVGASALGKGDSQLLLASAPFLPRWGLGSP